MWTILRDKVFLLTFIFGIDILEISWILANLYIPHYEMVGFTRILIFPNPILMIISISLIPLGACLLFITYMSLSDYYHYSKIAMAQTQPMIIEQEDIPHLIIVRKKQTKAVRKGLRLFEKRETKSYTQLMAELPPYKRLDIELEKQGIKRDKG